MMEYIPVTHTMYREKVNSLKVAKILTALIVCIMAVLVQSNTVQATIDGYAAPLSGCNFSAKLYEPKIHTARTSVYYGNGQVFSIVKPFAVEGAYLISHSEKLSVNTPTTFTVASKQFDVQQSPMFL